jgi:hypothetical protein
MSYNKGDKIISDIIIYDDSGNGYSFKFLLDTGSDITFISNNIFQKLKLKSSSTGSMLVGNNTTSSVKLTNLNLSFPEHSKYIHVNVGVIPDKKDFDVILGMDIISYCNINISTVNTGFDFDIELPSCK